MMQPSDDQPPLKGAARSLDDLFTRVEAEPGTVPTPPPPVARVPPPLPTDGPDRGDIVEGPVLDADVLVEEISGPVESQPRVDPEEERRVRLRTAADSLSQAVDALAAGEGDAIALASLVRDDAVTLREGNVLEPLVDAVERLARLTSPDDPTHPARELVRAIATPAVSVGLALRLAGARDAERREELAATCRRLGEEAAVALVAVLVTADDRSVRRNLVAGLVAMGEHGLRQAEKMVQEGSSWGVVRNGVSILAELGGKRAVEHLMDTVQHHHPKVRRETITALARIGGEGATLLVMSRIEDPDDEVRATAVRAAGTLGSERVVRTLLARLDDEQSADVTQEILRALGQLGDPGAVPAIEKRAVGSFFKRPSPAVRIAAYRALALIGTPHAMGLIEAAIEDKDPEVRSAARALAGRG